LDEVGKKKQQDDADGDADPRFSASLCATGGRSAGGGTAGIAEARSASERLGAFRTKILRVSPCRGLWRLRRVGLPLCLGQVRKLGKTHRPASIPVDDYRPPNPPPDMITA